MGHLKLEYFLTVLVVLAFFSGFFLGARPWETPTDINKYLSELYEKPASDNIDLSFIKVLTDKCVFAYFEFEGELSKVLMCEKNITKEELIAANGGDGQAPPFSGARFGYATGNLGFSQEDSDEARLVNTQKISRIIHYVEP